MTPIANITKMTRRALLRASAPAAAAAVALPSLAASARPLHDIAFVPTKVGADISVEEAIDQLSRYGLVVGQRGSLEHRVLGHAECQRIIRREHDDLRERAIADQESPSWFFDFDARIEAIDRSERTALAILDRVAGTA